MAKEPEYFREILQYLLERFGKPNINAKEYAKYLRKNEEIVRNQIRARELPGKVIHNKKTDNFIIPVASIAMFEAKSSNV